MESSRPKEIEQNGIELPEEKDIVTQQPALKSVKNVTKACKFGKLYPSQATELESKVSDILLKRRINELPMIDSKKFQFFANRFRFYDVDHDIQSLFDFYSSKNENLPKLVNSRNFFLDLLGHILSFSKEAKSSKVYSDIIKQCKITAKNEKKLICIEHIQSLGKEWEKQKNEKEKEIKELQNRFDGIINKNKSSEKDYGVYKKNCQYIDEMNEKVKKGLELSQQEVAELAKASHYIVNCSNSLEFEELYKIEIEISKLENKKEKINSVFENCERILKNEGVKKEEQVQQMRTDVEQDKKKLTESLKKEFENNNNKKKNDFITAWINCVSLYRYKIINSNLEFFSSLWSTKTVKGNSENLDLDKITDDEVAFEFYMLFIHPYIEGEFSLDKVIDKVRDATKKDQSNLEECAGQWGSMSEKDLKEKFSLEQGEIDELKKHLTELPLEKEEVDEYDFQNNVNLKDEVKKIKEKIEELQRKIRTIEINKLIGEYQALKIYFEKEVKKLNLVAKAQKLADRFKTETEQLRASLKTCRNDVLEAIKENFDGRVVKLRAEGEGKNININTADDVEKFIDEFMKQLDQLGNKLETEIPLPKKNVEEYVNELKRDLIEKLVLKIQNLYIYKTENEEDISRIFEHAEKFSALFKKYKDYYAVNVDYVEKINDQAVSCAQKKVQKNKEKLLKNIDINKLDDIKNYLDELEKFENGAKNLGIDKVGVAKYVENNQKQFIEEFFVTGVKKIFDENSKEPKTDVIDKCEKYLEELVEEVNKVGLQKFDFTILKLRQNGAIIELLENYLSGKLSSIEKKSNDINKVSEIIDFIKLFDKIKFEINKEELRKSASKLLTKTFKAAVDKVKLKEKDLDNLIRALFEGLRYDDSNQYDQYILECLDDIDWSIVENFFSKYNKEKDAFQGCRDRINRIFTSYYNKFDKIDEKSGLKKLNIDFKRIHCSIGEIGAGKIQACFATVDNIIKGKAPLEILVGQQGENISYDTLSVNLNNLAPCDVKAGDTVIIQRNSHVQKEHLYELIVYSCPNFYHVASLLTEPKEFAQFKEHKNHFACLMVAGDKIFKKKDAIKRIANLPADSLNGSTFQYMLNNGCFNVVEYDDFLDYKIRKAYKTKFKDDILSKLQGNNVTNENKALIKDMIDGKLSRAIDKISDKAKKHSAIEKYVKNFENYAFSKGGEKDSERVNVIKTLIGINYASLDDDSKRLINNKKLKYLSETPFECFISEENKDICNIALDVLENNLGNEDKKSKIVRLASNLFTAIISSMSEEKVATDLEPLKKILQLFAKIKENAVKEEAVYNELNKVFDPNNCNKANNGLWTNFLEKILINIDSFATDDIYNLFYVMPKNKDGTDGVKAFFRNLFNIANEKQKDGTIVQLMSKVVSKLADAEVNADEALKTFNIMQEKINLKQKSSFIESLKQSADVNKGTIEFATMFDKIATRLKFEDLCDYVVDEDQNNKKIWLSEKTIKALIKNKIKKEGSLSINNVCRIAQFLKYPDGNGKINSQERIEAASGFLEKEFIIDDEFKADDSSVQEAYLNIKKNLSAILGNGKISTSALEFMLKASAAAKEENKLTLLDIITMLAAHKGKVPGYLSGLIVDRVGAILKASNGQGILELVGEEYFEKQKISEKEDCVKHILRNLYFKLEPVTFKDDIDKHKDQINAFAGWLMRNYSKDYNTRYKQVLRKFRDKDENNEAEKIEQSLTENKKDNMLRAVNGQMELLRLFSKAIYDKNKGLGNPLDADGIFDKGVTTDLLGLVSDTKQSTCKTELNSKVNNVIKNSGIEINKEELVSGTSIKTVCEENKKLTLQEMTCQSTEMDTMFGNVQKYLGTNCTRASEGMQKRCGNDRFFMKEISNSAGTLWGSISTSWQETKSDIKNNGFLQNLQFKIFGDKNEKSSFGIWFDQDLTNCARFKAKELEAKIVGQVVVRVEPQLQIKKWSVRSIICLSLITTPLGGAAGFGIAAWASGALSPLILGALIGAIAALAITIGCCLLRNRYLEKRIQSVHSTNDQAINEVNDTKLEFKEAVVRSFRSNTTTALSSVSESLESYCKKENKNCEFEVEEPLIIEKGSFFENGGYGTTSPIYQRYICSMGNNQVELEMIEKQKQAGYMYNTINGVVEQPNELIEH